MNAAVNGCYHFGVTPHCTAHKKIFSCQASKNHMKGHKRTGCMVCGADDGPQLMSHVSNWQKRWTKHIRHSKISTPHHKVPNITPADNIIQAKKAFMDEICAHIWYALPENFEAIQHLWNILLWTTLQATHTLQQEQAHSKTSGIINIPVHPTAQGTY